MSPEEAWSRACKFTADRSVVITQITKYSLDKVIYLIEAGQMRKFLWSIQRNDCSSSIKGLSARVLQTAAT